MARRQAHGDRTSHACGFTPVHTAVHIQKNGPGNCRRYRFRQRRHRSSGLLQSKAQPQHREEEGSTHPTPTVRACLHHIVERVVGEREMGSCTARSARSLSYTIQHLLRLLFLCQMEQSRLDCIALDSQMGERRQEGLTNEDSRYSCEHARPCTSRASAPANHRSLCPLPAYSIVRKHREVTVSSGHSPPPPPPPPLLRSAGGTGYPVQPPRPRPSDRCAPFPSGLAGFYMGVIFRYGWRACCPGALKLPGHP